MRGYWYILVLSLFVGCKLVQPYSGQSQGTPLQKAMRNNCDASALTAKASVQLIVNGKSLPSLSGSLKMKRDDVIQLSLSFMGLMEVGRLEFTKDSVLVVDRINKRYTHTTYSKLDFLRKSKIDFFCLQALFWHEVFAPSYTNASDAPFTVGTSGDYTLLTLASSPALDFSFLLNTQTGLLDRTTVSSKNTTEPTTFTFKYADFIKFAGGQFPSALRATIRGGASDIEMHIGLTNLKKNANWTTRISIPSRYEEKTIDEVLQLLTTLNL